MRILAAERAARGAVARPAGAIAGAGPVAVCQGGLPAAAGVAGQVANLDPNGLYWVAAEGLGDFKFGDVVPGAVHSCFGRGGAAFRGVHPGLIKGGLYEACRGL